MNKKNRSKHCVDDELKGFFELCTRIQSVEDFSCIFDLFLTIEEKTTMASRYQIIKALLEGKLTQREIAQKHNVSIAQITRGSNALKIIDDKLERFLINALKEKQ